MKKLILALLTLSLALPAGCRTLPQEVPRGKGMSEANKERLVIDDMADVSDWTNGSPEETKLSSSGKHPRDGRPALLFANVVDYTKGEKNYPIGWPRTYKDMAKIQMSEWSAYDFFECWIYTETSRDDLPTSPLNLGFTHTGHKRSTNFALKEIKKDGWAHIVIPIPKLQDARDVLSIRFNISESSYKHQDRVDFYISDMALTRFVEPAIAAVSLDRNIAYSNDRHITATYSLVGHKGMDEASAEITIQRGSEPPSARTAGKASRKGDILLDIAQPLDPGMYRVMLSLRDPTGALLDRKENTLRIVSGPF